MNELEDFSDLEEVDGWEPSTNKGNLLALALLIAFIGISGLLIYAYYG